MWGTETPLPKALQRLLSTPVRRPTRHGALEFKSHAGETSQQVGDSLNTRLHKRLTLQTGNIHWKAKEFSQSRNLFIAIDPHPSVSMLIPDLDRALINSFFSQWGSRHRLHVQFLEGHVSDGWGPTLTDQWQRELRSFRDGRLLILSDFHGPHFFSESLRQLVHHFDTHFVRLCHPLPEHRDVELIQSINDKTSETYRFTPEDFQKRFDIWDQQTTLALKKTGCPHLVTGNMDLVELVKGILKFWN